MTRATILEIGKALVQANKTGARSYGKNSGSVQWHGSSHDGQGGVKKVDRSLLRKEGKAPKTRVVAKLRNN